MRFIFLIFTLGLVSCSEPNPQDIEHEIERWLLIDISSNFKIVENNYSWAIGDDLNTITIEYPLQTYEKFINSVDLTQWNKLERGYQFVAQKEQGTSGYDFFSISASPSEDRRLRIQYGSE